MSDKKNEIKLFEVAKEGLTYDDLLDTANRIQTIFREKRYTGSEGISALGFLLSGFALVSYKGSNKQVILKKLDVDIDALRSGVHINFDDLWNSGIRQKQ